MLNTFDFSKPNLDKIEVRSPFDNHLVGYVPDTPVSYVSEMMDVAETGRKEAFALSKKQRSDILKKVVHKLQDQYEVFVSAIVNEAGKTVQQARKEVDRCMNTLSLSASEAMKSRGELIDFEAFSNGENRHGYYERFPLGIVLAITPFNDPLNLVAHKLGPALAVGNAVILKPSLETPLSAFLLVKAFHDSGLPSPALQVCVASHAKDQSQESLASTLVQQRNIRAISFTGGNTTAEKITKQAGLKRMLMDLGGNAPVIVCADCDLDKAVESSVSGAFWAAGQNCIGVQRILIERSCYEAFKTQFVAQTKALVVGDPNKPETDVGPMINERAATTIEARVEAAIQQGAKLLTGHIREGNLYHPTVLENVLPTCDIRVNEVFAPVVMLQPVDSIDEAIQIANESETSLQAGIFTKQLDVALHAAKWIEAGGVMINDSSDFRVDSMPFGGFKYGSMGREGVEFAAEELSQYKVICFNHN